MISDGVVSQEETEYLLTRLADNGMTDNIMVDVPLHRIDRMLSDGLLGKDVIPDPNKR